MSHLVRYAAGLCVAGYGALQVLGRQAGSTPQERRQTLAGDAAVRYPHAVTNHAITIGAPPEAVWPWLTQMGWHLGGYYTPRWVDRLLFPANLPSADVLDPGLVRDLAAGDTIPDGPPGTAWFVVEEADPPSTLVLHSTTHVPPSWRDKFGAAVDWTWSFQLTGLPDDRTRLHVRVRGRAAPRWLAAAYITAIIPADFIMTTGMLRGLKRRAEQTCIASVPVRPAADPVAGHSCHPPGHRADPAAHPVHGPAHPRRGPGCPCTGLLHRGPAAPLHADRHARRDQGTRGTKALPMPAMLTQRSPPWSPWRPRPDAAPRAAAARPRPAAVAAIKTIHTLAWLSIESCVLYVLYAGFADRTGKRVGIAGAIVAAETLVFAGNGFRCPLTGLAERYGAQSGSVTDIYLPKWFAHNMPVIHAPLLVLMTYLHARNLRRSHSAAHQIG